MAVRTAYKRADDFAIEVWVALEEAGVEGLTLVELQKRTGLSRAQVKAGIAQVNHVLQLAKEQPIMVVTHGWRYVLPELYKDLLPWVYNRLGDMLTRMQTERTRLLSADGKWPQVIPRNVTKAIDRLIEDLSELKEWAERERSA